MERPEITRQQADEFCREILPAVSRTFALSIRVLPGELGAAVRCAYLICRIADTLEDEAILPAESKAALLHLLAGCLDDANGIAAFKAAVAPVSGDPAHVRLVANSDLVFTAYRHLPDRTREIVGRWTREMIVGMRQFVLAYPDGVRIQSLAEYKEYCYYVAGTVGYLLTDLWHEHSRSIGARRYLVLRDRCRAFAEGLQTVNILKDVVCDAEHENAIYIPEQLLRAHGSAHATILAIDHARENRAALSEMTQLAWHNLDEAKAYLLAIPRRAVAIRLFCALPLLFAYATLRDLTRASDGAGVRGLVKISRSEVKVLTALSLFGVLSNRAMARLVERTKAKALLVG
jgi:farnesyl-diphosphate farnesyltransferase